MLIWTYIRYYEWDVLNMQFQIYLLVKALKHLKAKTATYANLHLKCQFSFRFFNIFFS